MIRKIQVVEDVSNLLFGGGPTAVVGASAVSPMSNSLGRGGRRRRMLNEEMVAASGTHPVPQGTGSARGSRTEGPSYSEAARQEQHSRVTDLIPRRCATIWLGLFLGLALVAGLLALHTYRATVSEVLGAPAITALDVTSAGSLATWLRAVLLLLVSCCCLLIYSLRRHKLDDYRGRYRVWSWAAAAFCLLSINAVTGLHAVGATSAAYFSGWTALANDAIWWLVPGTLLFGWIGVRSVRDLWESRLARVTSLLAAVALVVALVGSLGWLPDVASLSTISSGITPAAILLGDLFLLTAVISYARFVVLDAQGEISTNRGRPQRKAKPKQKSAAKPKRQRESSTRTTPQAESVATKRATASRETNVTEWVDGRHPVSDPEFDGEDTPSNQRKLSKSERKKLRKQKAQQRRAA